MSAGHRRSLTHQPLKHAYAPEDTSFVARPRGLPSFQKPLFTQPKLIFLEVHSAPPTTQTGQLWPVSFSESHHHNPNFLTRSPPHCPCSTTPRLCCFWSSPLIHLATATVSLFVYHSPPSALSPKFRRGRVGLGVSTREKKRAGR